MLIIYKRYLYAPKATFVSFISYIIGLGSIVLFLCSLGMIFSDKPLIGIAATPVSGCLLALCIYGWQFLPEKLAKTETIKNITTTAKYGRLYVKNNPEQYTYIRTVNPAFANKY
ncbi:MAG: hypothetical protein K6G26_11590, partial [Lachnospiraceae bacterium]|nr:hypothetical protein [Lachnospiraceae bacterium]